MRHEKIWDSYHRFYHTFTTSSPTYNEMLERILGCVGPKPKHVLDLGCGTGTLMLKLKSAGYNVTGLEKSGSAHDRIKKFNPTLNVVISDLSEVLPFEDEEFDTVTLVNVLYTLSTVTVSKLMREIHRVLKTDGNVIIADPRPDFSNWQIFIGDYKKMIGKGLKKIMKRIPVQIASYFILMVYNMIIDRAEKNKVFRFRSLSEFEKLLNSHRFCIMRFDKVYNLQDHLILANKV